MSLVRSIPGAMSLAVTRLCLGGVVAALCLGSAPGRAATQEDEDACRPDVFRLCASAIPDETAIVACLNANLPGLSAECQRVMDPAGDVSRSTPVPRRGFRRPSVSP